MTRDHAAGGGRTTAKRCTSGLSAAVTVSSRSSSFEEGSDNRHNGSSDNLSQLEKGRADPKGHTSRPVGATGVSLARSILADLFVVGLLCFIFTFRVFDTEGFVADAYGLYNISFAESRLNVGMGCHIWSPLIGLWLYCICASPSGAGSSRRRRPTKLIQTIAKRAAQPGQSSP